jgi:hypothetical protein
MTYTRSGEFVSKETAPGLTRDEALAHLATEGYTMLREIITVVAPDGRQVDVVVVSTR